MLSSDITVCIVTNNNYKKLNECVISLRRNSPASKIHVVDISKDPKPKYFPDGVEQYFIMEYNSPEVLTKGILIESTYTNALLFLSDSFVCSGNTDLRKLATPKVKLHGFRLADGRARIARYPFFNTVKYSNPNLPKGAMMDPDLVQVQLQPKPLELRPLQETEKAKKVPSKKKKYATTAGTNPDNVFKSEENVKGNLGKFTGKWLDVQTGFQYNVYKNGTSKFIKIPGFKPKFHNWKISPSGIIQITNSYQYKFTVMFKEDNTMRIIKSNAHDFDFAHLIRAGKERIFKKIK